MSDNQQPFRFANVSCSQCGRDFGPGNHGYSHCDSHRRTLDKPAPGKHVKVRGRKYNGDNELMHGHYTGIIREVKNDGDVLVLESGWHMNLNLGDELIWCADKPAPMSLQ